ncbi:MAG: hypothetical protein U0R80_01220 [Nocardioidaceae bacterium]
MSTTAFSCESASGFGTDIWAARTRADGTWGKPVAVAHGLSPQLVVDGSGRVTVAYRLRHGAGVGAVRWSGGSWHVPVVLAQPPPNLSFIPSIALAANARGDVMLTWAQQEDCCGGRHIGFIVATRPHDGSWGPSVIVSRKDRFGRTFLDAQGRGTAVSSRLLFRRTTAGRWTSRALPAIEGYLSGVAANAGGDLMLSARDPDGAPSTVSILEKPDGAAWLPVVELTTSASVNNATPLVLDTHGRAAIGFKGVDESFTVATRPAGGTWTSGDAVSAADVHAHVLRLESGPRGALGACWLQRAPDGTQQVWASLRPPAGSWSAPVRLTGARWLEVWHPVASMRSDGSMVVTWSGKIAQGRAMRVSSRLVTPVA